jgi:Multiubiquitin
VDETRADTQNSDTASGGITIYIDHNAFRVDRPALTGRALRELATPAIGSRYELYRVLPGSDDVVVRDEEVVDLDDGTQFFSAPRMILAG